jgi:TRAP-type mannitol/chloroaromatic compound transport system permease small subunit
MTEKETSGAVHSLGYQTEDVGQLPMAIRVSEILRKMVDTVGRFGSWLIVPVILITVMDLTIRKLVWIQLWLLENVGRFFDSTVLQELEWHFHTGLFALVLGYGYICNSHVRVDLIREHLSFRKQAWLELLGLTFFLIPFISVIIWFATIYAYDSFMMGEISASTVGLTNRWIIKSVLLVGLIFVALAGVAVWLQVVIALWGPQDVRFPLMTLDWPEEAGTRIEGKVRLKFEDMEDQLAKKSAQAREEATSAPEEKTG